MERVGIDDPAASERDSLTTLYRELRQPLARLAYVLTSDAAFADEVVQDAFVQLSERWAGIDNPAGYARVAVINRCYSHLRRVATTRRTPLPPATPVMPVYDELGDALAKLAPERRAVLALRYYADLTDAEIAEALGIRRSTVRTRAHRALAELRRELST